MIAAHNRIFARYSSVHQHRQYGIINFTYRCYRCSSVHVRYISLYRYMLLRLYPRRYIMVTSVPLRYLLDCADYNTAPIFSFDFRHQHRYISIYARLQLGAYRYISLLFHHGYISAWPAPGITSLPNCSMHRLQQYRFYSSVSSCSQWYMFNACRFAGSLRLHSIGTQRYIVAARLSSSVLFSFMLDFIGPLGISRPCSVCHNRFAQLEQLGTTTVDFA
jgi:hypothetical protein